jgi:hypothetical protein
MRAGLEAARASKGSEEDRTVSSGALVCLLCGQKGIGDSRFRSGSAHQTRTLGGFGIGIGWPGLARMNREPAVSVSRAGQT